MAGTSGTADQHSRQVCAVFGASGGIGSALCRLLAAKGGVVVAIGRSADKIHALASELGIDSAVLEATDFEQADACLKALKEKHGRIDAVTNCVGSLLLKSAHQTSEQEYQDTIAANLGSAFAVVRASTKVMMQTGGSIVLISSAAGRLGLPNHDAIAAAKAGVVGLTLSAAASYARQGIRVNCVAPGMVRTPLTEKITRNDTALQASVAMHPLQRIGEPGDVASAIAWLVDPQNRWVTGQVLGVDGGLATVRSKR
jgi:NAD(P)-dependent dehydrogenase (short-subunit alcohol dehydrogenase family)